MSDPSLSTDAAEAVVTAVLGGSLRLLPGTALVPDGTSVRLDALDTGQVWTMVLGTVAGTDHAVLTGYEGPAQVTGALFGTTHELHRWVSGLQATTTLEVEGDPTVVDRLHAVLHRARAEGDAGATA